MNYIIEGDLNFLTELNKEINDNEEKKDVCLISGNELEEKHVKLNCGHCFNYEFLYNEVKYQKNTNLDPKKLSIKEIRCPYCRKIHPNLLPQIKGFTKVSGVNSPEKYCMYLYKCSYRDKNNIICSKPCNSLYCNKHAKMLDKPLFRCICKTTKGARCKNNGLIYSNLKYFNKEPVIFCGIHKNLHDKNLLLYEDGKVENIIKII